MNKDGTYGGDLMIQANCRGLNGGQVFADNGATCWKKFISKFARFSRASSPFILLF
jgi:hypothetical protein